MSKVDYVRQLQRLYKWSVGIYIVCAVAALGLMNNTAYQLTLGHLAKDELVSTKSAVLVPGAHAVYDLQMRWAVAVIMLLSVAAPLLYVTRWQKKWQKAVKKRLLVWRWIDLALTTALMIEVIAILSGVQDIMTLKMIGGLMVLTCGLGWLAERASNEAKKLTMPIFITSLVVGTLPWLLVFAYAIATPFYAAARAPWYVYALYASSLGSFTLLAMNQWRHHLKFKQWKDYLVVERDYAVIALLAKVAFAVILIVGLQK